MEIPMADWGSEGSRQFVDGAQLVCFAVREFKKKETQNKEKEHANDSSAV